MSDTALTAGRPVQPIEGEAEIWPTLAIAALGTTVEDSQGEVWSRHRKWWSGPDGARLTSHQLSQRGPLTVRSVHECEEWINISTMCSASVTYMCVSCGATKEEAR
jgi:hypothetical protein